MKLFFVICVLNKVLGLDASSMKVSTPVNEVKIMKSNETNVATLDLNIDNTQSLMGSIPDAYYNANYVGATYCNINSIQDWSCLHCKRLGSNITVEAVFDSEVYDTRALIVTNHQRKEIVLAFRGSSNIRNWITNVKFFKKPYTGVPGAQVHSGFKECADGFLPIYGLAIRSLISQPRYEQYNIVVTGHSLGGAIALLATLNLQSYLNLSWSKFSLYTYGQPRVGNKAFSSWVNKLPLSITRAVNENDMVPHVPPTTVDFIHQRTEMYITKSDTRICSDATFEDTTCSNSRVPIVTVDAHLKAWDIPLGLFVC